MKFNVNYLCIFFLIILNNVQIVGSENETASLLTKERIRTKSISKKTSTQSPKKSIHNHKTSDSRKKVDFFSNTNNHTTSFSIDSLEDQIRKPENISIKTLEVNDTIKSSKAIEFDGGVIEKIEKPVLTNDEHKSMEEVIKFKEEGKNNNINELNSVILTNSSTIKKENTSNNDVSNVTIIIKSNKEPENSFNKSKVEEKSLKVPDLKKEVIIIDNTTKSDIKMLENNEKLKNQTVHENKKEIINNNVENIFPTKEKEEESLKKVEVLSNNSSDSNNVKAIDFEKSSNSKVKNNGDKNNMTIFEKNNHNIFLKNTSVENLNISNDQIFTNASINKIINSTDFLVSKNKTSDEVIVVTDIIPLNSSITTILTNKIDTNVLKEDSNQIKEEEIVPIKSNLDKVQNGVVKDKKEHKSTFFVIKVINNKIVEEQTFDDEIEVRRFLSTTTPPPPTTTTLPTTTTTHPTTTTIQPIPPSPVTTTSTTTTSSSVPRGMPPSAKPPNDEVIKRLNTAIDFISIAKELKIFRRI